MASYQPSPCLCSSERFRGRRARIAFSLVEIVIAVGVATVALIGIFALMQSGLRTYREAMNSTITSSIGQQVLSQYLLADFEKVASLPQQVSYYDERGLALPEAEADKAVYCSVAQVRESSTLGVDRQNLVGVSITVTSPMQPSLRKVFTSLIGRQGKDTP